MSEKEELTKLFDDCQAKYEAWEAAKQRTSYARNEECSALNAYEAAKGKWNTLIKSSNHTDKK